MTLWSTPHWSSLLGLYSSFFFFFSFMICLLYLLSEVLVYLFWCGFFLPFFFPPCFWGTEVIPSSEHVSFFYSARPMSLWPGICVAAPGCEYFFPSNSIAPWLLIGEVGKRGFYCTSGLCPSLSGSEQASIISQVLNPFTMVLNGWAAEPAEQQTPEGKPHFVSASDSFRLYVEPLGAK